MELSCDAAAQAIRAVKCDIVTFFYCVPPKKTRCAKKQTLGGETQQQTTEFIGDRKGDRNVEEGPGLRAGGGRGGRGAMAVGEVALPGADVPGHGSAGPPHADVQRLHADAQVSRVISSQLV